MKILSFFGILKQNKSDEFKIRCPHSALKRKGISPLPFYQKAKAEK